MVGPIDVDTDYVRSRASAYEKSSYFFRGVSKQYLNARFTSSLPLVRYLSFTCPFLISLSRFNPNDLLRANYSHADSKYANALTLYRLEIHRLLRDVARRFLAAAAYFDFPTHLARRADVDLRLSSSTRLGP